MEANKMTIFYKKRNLEIKAICYGVQSLRFFGEDIEDNEMIYSMLVIDRDIVIYRNIKDFYLEQDINGEVFIKIKDDFKKELQKYL